MMMSFTDLTLTRLLHDLNLYSMHPILIETYYNLASQPAATATEVVRASLSAAILSDQVIGDDVWKEILMLDIKLVSDLLPSNWKPDKGIWEYALKSKNQSLVNMLFTKYPVSFVLTELDESALQNNGSILPPIKDINLGQDAKFRMSTVRLEWLADNSPALFAAIQNNFITEILCSSKLINLIDLSRLRTWASNHFNTRATTDYETLFTRIIPALNAPKFANPEISRHLTEMGWNREGSRECVSIYAKSHPAEYMQWLKLQVFGGQYTYLGKEIKVAPVGLDHLKEHWNLVSERAELRSLLDLDYEMAIFSSSIARSIFAYSLYSWPAITQAWKNGSLNSQKLIADYLASPCKDGADGAQDDDDENIKDGHRSVNQLVLSVLNSIERITFNANSKIQAGNIPLDIIKLCLEKASPKDELLAHLLKSGASNALRHILSTEDVSTLIPQYLNIRECDSSDFSKVNPANLEALLALSRGDPHKFNALVWRIAKPSIEILKEAVAVDCPRFKIRYVKNEDILVLCRMAELARQPRALEFLKEAVRKRGLQLETAIASLNK